jgi:hypothetical protein
MAYKTKSAWDLDMQGKITTNNNNLITGAIHQQVWQDQSDSILWGQMRKQKGVTVNAAGTTVNFPSALSGANYVLIVRCYDTTGQVIGYTIDPARQTNTGFHILPVQDGTIDYIAAL